MKNSRCFNVEKSEKMLKKTAIQALSEGKKQACKSGFHP